MADEQENDGRDGSSSGGASAKEGEGDRHVRIKARYKGQCTLLGFDRGDDTTLRELVAKTCSRMHLKGPVSDYALFVSQGNTNIRVFEMSDLKDGDQCELVQIQEYEDYSDDSDDEELEDSDDEDDDDKTVPMPAEKPSPETPSQPLKKKKVDSRKRKSTDNTDNKMGQPSRSSLRGAIKQSLAEAAFKPFPPEKRSPRLERKRRNLNRQKAVNPQDLLQINKRNQHNIEPESLLIFERYNDGHFQEAIFKKYLATEKQLKEPEKCWAFVHFIDDVLPEKRWPRNWVDLNSFRAFVLDKDAILTAKDKDRDVGQTNLGRRLRIKWKDGNYYDGSVTKTLSSDRDFVFIEYDDGDHCWSNLREELDALELPVEGAKSGRKNEE